MDQYQQLTGSLVSQKGLKRLRKLHHRSAFCPRLQAHPYHIPAHQGKEEKVFNIYYDNWLHILSYANYDTRPETCYCSKHEKTIFFFLTKERVQLIWIWMLTSATHRDKDTKVQQWISLQPWEFIMALAWPVNIWIMK